jgi:biotin carboxyl carrier protein
MATRRGASAAKATPKAAKKAKAAEPAEAEEPKPAKKAKRKVVAAPSSGYVCCYTVTVGEDRRRKGDPWEGTPAEARRLLKIGAIEHVK